VVSSFGIGNDFDEKMMRGIAEHGCGKYAFIDKGENIPKHVSKAIHGLMDIVGSNVHLKVRGQNGAIVKTIYGKSEDIAKGVDLPYLVADNMRQIIIEIDVMPHDKTNPSIIYELSYSRRTEGAPTQSGEVVLKGILHLECTDDDSKLLEEDDGVVVAVKIQEAAQKDREIAKLLDMKKVDEAIAMKENLIADLKKIEKKDSTGRVTKLLALAEPTLQQMKSKKNLQKVKKDIDYHGYVEACDNDDEYREGSDSDEEEWSDNDHSVNQSANKSQSPNISPGGSGSETDDDDFDDNE